ncbi:UV-endonuclease UvdE-domain-containing protein [Cristinia sonorae]|uniref:UV-endonuclease UvdE-domain-containing protein n=1 Tax=Cristinia sonorae TaxID=1940300 RepID=A0A8K0UQY1_9AGAR|nr:UV-endonuclease UvdE-domain-containing protein [Cristinia sonorae]
MLALFLSRRVLARPSVAAMPKRKSSTRTNNPVDYAGDESPLTDLDVDEPPKKKRQRRDKDTEPVVYDIPPVERKHTNFTGRLGYACLNTLLRASKPDPIFCSRTCRLDTLRKNGLDFAKDLGKQNARDLCKLIEWNEENDIRFLRVSSEMFPFASHAEWGYSLEYAAEELKAAGDLAKRLGHRLTTHPGQFTQLGSPREAVVTASVRELDYHCQMMRHMGLDQDSVIVIHMGGVYGDKPTTLARFKENYTTKLTEEMKARLVLENDEMCYNVEDLLPVCNELNIPIVFDYHHDWIYPSPLGPPSVLIPLINETWHRKGIRPKQHLSSPRPGAETVMEKRAHAGRCERIPEECVGEVDLMVEAKDKEQAVLMLYRMYELYPVKWENLRPESEPKPFVRSAARKARDVAAAEEEEDDDGGGGGAAAGEQGEEEKEKEGEKGAARKKTKKKTRTSARTNHKEKAEKVRVRVDAETLDEEEPSTGPVVPPLPSRRKRKKAEVLAGDASGSTSSLLPASGATASIPIPTHTSTAAVDTSPTHPTQTPYAPSRRNRKKAQPSTRAVEPEPESEEVMMMDQEDEVGPVDGAEPGSVRGEEREEVVRDVVPARVGG